MTVKLDGWKAYLGALIVAAGAVLEYLFPGSKYSELLYAVGAALGIVGLRSKLTDVKPSA